MAGSPTSFQVEVLSEGSWRRLRAIRLTALDTDPTAFLASHEAEAVFGEQRWREEFARGEWNIMVAQGPGTDVQDVGLLGVTRLPAMPSWECYLEYLWVAPWIRGRGVASNLLRMVIDRLRESRVQTVWLYILDGNDGAMRLYQRFGFQRTNERQKLPDHPAGSEEKMRLRLY